MEDNSINESVKNYNNEGKEKVNDGTIKTPDENGRMKQNKSKEVDENNTIFKKSWNLDTSSFELKSVEELLKNPRMISQVRTYVIKVFCILFHLIRDMLLYFLFLFLYFHACILSSVLLCTHSFSLLPPR